ncbi:MAG: hypothetical protein AAB526_02240 [Patescibacteria group bacterium]
MTNIIKNILIIIVLGFLIYGFSLSNNFVWDDEEQIINNQAIHSIANFPKFFQGSTFNSGGSNSLTGLYYKPLMTSGFSIIYSLFGPNPFFFHLLSLIFHIGNSILIFLIFLRFFPNPIALFCSLIFLIHPINTEAVVYISSLQEVMFLFFGLISFYLFLKKKMPIFVGIFFLLSLLSKETAIGFFFLIPSYLILEKIINKKWEFYNNKILLYYFSFLTIYFFLRIKIAGILFQNHNLTPISKMEFYERLISIPKIIFFYLQNFFYPINLGISQHWVVTTFDFQNFWKPLLIVIGFFLLLIAGFIYLLKKKNKKIMVYIFFFLWFLIGIGMHLQIISLDMTVADRWFYFPIIGLLGMIGVILLEIKNKKTILIIGIIIVFLFSTRSFIRTLDWKNGLTLYSKDIITVVGSFDLENNLGVELYRNGDYKNAKIHFEKSTKIAPFWWTNWNNLGVSFENEKNFSKAVDCYQKAIDNGQYFLAYENMAKTLVFYGKDREKTEKFLQTALKLFPINNTLIQLNTLHQQSN